jgi:hypothetical protein
MSASVRHTGQFVHTGIQLGGLQNVSSYTTVLGGTHLQARFDHGVVSIDKDDAIVFQRELLAALAVHGYRPDVSGAVADLGDAS